MLCIEVGTILTLTDYKRESSVCKEKILFYKFISSLQLRLLKQRILIQFVMLIIKVMF